MKHTNADLGKKVDYSAGMIVILMAFCVKMFQFVATKMQHNVSNANEYAFESGWSDI